MKTIEERGQIAGQTYQFCKKEIEADHKIYEKGYIKGATEQKAIDEKEMFAEREKAFSNGYEVAKKELIEKACEWIETHTTIYDQGVSPESFMKDMSCPK